LQRDYREKEIEDNPDKVPYPHFFPFSALTWINSCKDLTENYSRMDKAAVTAFTTV